MRLKTIKLACKITSKAAWQALTNTDLVPAAKAAKAELQNVRAELSRILFEPKPENIRAKIFTLISQLFLIFMKQLVHNLINCRSVSLTFSDEYRNVFLLPVVFSYGSLLLIPLLIHRPTRHTKCVLQTQSQLSVTCASAFTSMAIAVKSSV